MPTNYLSPRYAAQRYFAPRYFAGALSGVGVIAAYSGALTILPSLGATLFRGSTNIIQLAKAEDVVDLTFPTDLVVVASLIDHASRAPVSQVTNLAMPYFAAAGNAIAAYRGLVLPSVPLPSALYDLVVLATDTSANVRQFTLQCPVEDG